MEEEVLECCDSESPTAMPATVYARGLATELEKCEVRRIVNHEERKQARQKLRNETSPPQTPVLPTMRTYPVTYQHGTPTTSTHRPPSTTLAQHTRAPQAAHTLPPACARHQPPSPHAAVRPQVPPTASHRMSPLRTPAATTDSPALQPRPLGLPGSRARPQPLPPLRGPQPPPPRAARGPSRTPPASHPSFFGFLTDTLRDHLGGYYVADAADHAWTIAVATGSTPLPPLEPTPMPQRRRLECGGPPHPPRPVPPPP